MSSAGPPPTVGGYAITNLVIKTQPANDAPPRASLPWAFDAAGPSMPTVFGSDAAPRTRGFAIVDDDLNGHAEWHTIKESAVAVNPSDTLVMGWDEAFSFGLAGRIRKLPPTKCQCFIGFAPNGSGDPGNPALLLRAASMLRPRRSRIESSKLAATCPERTPPFGRACSHLEHH